MYKEGDKIVLITNKYKSYYNKFGIYYGNVYIVSSVWCDFSEDYNKFFKLYGIYDLAISEKNMCDFLTIRDYRRLKMKKIDSRL